MKDKNFLFIIVFFYVGWLGSVLLARTSFSLASLIFPTTLVGFLFFKKNLTKKIFAFASIVSMLGIAFDLILIHFRLIEISVKTILPFPEWLAAIWILDSFSMLKLGPQINPPLWLSVLRGTIMGPLSYKSGEAFQILTFSNSMTFYIYALFWAAMLPPILTLSKRFP